MQVGKICTTSFSGVWTLDPKYAGCETTRDGSNGIFRADAIYHPFKDETQEETDKIFTTHRPVYGFSKYEDPWGPNAYEIINYTIGEKLDVTSSQYIDDEDCDKNSKCRSICINSFD